MTQPHVNVGVTYIAKWERLSTVRRPHFAKPSLSNIRPLTTINDRSCIRSAARAMESRVIRAHLRSGDLYDLNQSYEIEEYKFQEGVGYKLEKGEHILSELEQFVEYNNLAVGNSEVDPRLVGLAIQQAKLNSLKK